MNYAALHNAYSGVNISAENNAPQQKQKPIQLQPQQKQTRAQPQQQQSISLSYNRGTTPSTGQPNVSAVPNTVVLRDGTGGATVNALNANTMNIHGSAKLSGAIDTSLCAGVVCSSSTGILSSRKITTDDIANLTIGTADIRDKAITCNKLEESIFLSGTPTCNFAAKNNERHIANIGYVNRYVSRYVVDYLEKHVKRGRHSCHHDDDHDGDQIDLDSDSDEDEFDPDIFHVSLPNYVMTFNYQIYIVENSSVVIGMPRKKKEGYSVKIYNKSGGSIMITSDADRVMYNATYAYSGTILQIVGDNRCVVLTIVYKGTNRSWSFDYF